METFLPREKIQSNPESERKEGSRVKQAAIEGKRTIKAEGGNMRIVVRRQAKEEAKRNGKESVYVRKARGVQKVASVIEIFTSYRAVLIH